MTLAPTTPQPSKSISNSRSNRVLEQLQETWDSLQKDVTSTKTQLDTISEAKVIHEQQSKDYIQSNQQCRTQIQELMGILETKQHSLDLTKQQSIGLETQAKKLKDDAMMSRKNLDDLKKRESRLVQDRDAAVLAKTRVEQQQKILQQSIHDLDHRLIREQQHLKKELDQIQRQINHISKRNEWMAEIMISNMKSESEIREDWIQQVYTQRQQQDKITELFIDRIKSELQILLDQVDSLGCVDSHVDNRNSNRLNALDLDQKVEQCKAEVSGLIHRIQSYSVLALQ